MDGTEHLWLRPTDWELVCDSSFFHIWIHILEYIRRNLTPPISLLVLLSPRLLTSQGISSPPECGMSEEAADADWSLLSIASVYHVTYNSVSRRWIKGTGNGKTWEEHCAIKSTCLMNLSWTNSVGLLLHKSTDNSPCKRSHTTIHHFLPISLIFLFLKFIVQSVWTCSCTLLCCRDMYVAHQGNGFFLNNLCKYCHVLHQQ